MNANRLPRIRLNLDFMPSPIEDRPGLLIRDPFRYSDVTAIIPPALVPCLKHFNGLSAEADLIGTLAHLAGGSDAGGLARHLIDTLSGAAFLEDEEYARIRDLRHQEFAAATVRAASHAGSAYPAEEKAARAKLRSYLTGAALQASAVTALPACGKLLGIAAPHVSPEGGWRSYGAAYAALPPDLKDRTFVILGTSHYGDPERFGLTRKPFTTPLGRTTV